MAKDSTKPPTRGATGRVAAPPIRRTRLRRRPEGLIASLQGAMTSGTFGWGTVIALVFIILCGSLAVWARERPLVAPGRIMNFTAVVRQPFQMPDIPKTERSRELARQQTPRVYDADLGALERIRVSIWDLPRAASAVETVDDIPLQIRREFSLTPEMFDGLRAQVESGEVSAAWRSAMTNLMDLLEQYAFVDGETWDRELREGLNVDVELRTGSDSLVVARENIVSIRDEPKLRQLIPDLVRLAGFPPATSAAIVNRLISDPAPTFRFNPGATLERQNQAATTVASEIKEVPQGQVIFRRGDVLDQEQADLYRAELDVFRTEAEAYRVWFRRASLFGAVAAITLATMGYIALFLPRVRRNPGRMGGIAAVMAGALAITCVGAVGSPNLIVLWTTAPVVFVAIVLAIAYDQRVALAIGVLQGVLACISIDQPIGMFALTITGLSVAVLHLREVRDRKGLVAMGVRTGMALAIGAIVVALIDRPIIAAQILQTVKDAGYAAGGGILAGIITLAILPYLEKAFDITTGMTLIELRDPKHPLLRELQQRAPGTYNHSLNVATIAESAAEGIGADSLLTYVGALYHDIGKMNKPEYFVENQSGGPNRHDKLSPAMSLLVIVGHVKDGMELAREFEIPRSVQHFIEAHHGTTLVEYFYERARRKAEAEAADRDDFPEPKEIEYRYPGPKPRTKEVAILMLADAVESATRTMAEPTPSRIETLVNDLANRRLLDGQFDDCDLTLRELRIIVDSISRTLASIYHGRIAYPTTAGA